MLSHCCKMDIKNFINNKNFNELCRTCLSQKEVETSVFSYLNSLQNIEEKLNVNEILMECTSVNIYQDDGLPTKICTECVLWLTRAFKFKRQCEQSDVMLRKFLIKNETQESVNNESPSSDTETVANEGCTASNVKSNDDLLEVYMIVDKKEDIKNQSTVRNKHYRHLKQTDHTRMYMKTKEYRTRNRTKNITTTFLCNICNKSFHKPSDLRQHRQRHMTDKSFICEVCSRSFSTLSNMQEHMKIHNDEKPALCPKCGRRFRNTTILRDHLITHNEHKLFQCTVCGKLISRPRYLKYHMRIHTGESPFKCSQCDKAFHMKQTLSRHIENCHTEKQIKEKPFRCSYCDKCFTIAHKLKSHVRVHTGDTPFKCTECEKKFTLKQSLLRHIEKCHISKT